MIFLALSTAIVVAALVAGFVIIPSPAQQRIYDLDAKRVSALDVLESAVNVYVAGHKELPANLAELTGTVKWSAEGAKDVETGRPYDYFRGQGLDYRLCATFSASSQRGATGFSWHPAGYYCQHRTATRLPKP